MSDEAGDEIFWGEHARDALLLRAQVGAARVEDAIRHPDQDLPAEEGRYPRGRRIAQKMIELDGRRYLLRVVYDPVPGGRRVVTFYRTSQLRRYGRST